MIVPNYWAEARIREKIGKQQFTVRRFGWSNESQAAAQQMADERAREALARIVAGEELPRRDLKRAYNGSEGLPIREEVVERLGETVLTRNSYGAVCLNTPDALFADIDFDKQPSCGLGFAVFGVLLAGAAAIGWQVGIKWGCVAAAVALVVSFPLAAWLHLLVVWLAGGSQELARRRVTAFLSSHPRWHLRLYRTPAGLRVLAMHQPFSPADGEVAEFFAAIGTDPIYVRMCLRQNCFRARVSPKPWRIGIADHLKPVGVWPIDPERLPERRAWIERYDRAAKSFAACRSLEALGSGAVHPKVAEVQRLHDELCQANRNLDIA